MKKSKLLGLVALASLGLNANAADEIGTDVTYYVQNVESGLFMSGTNNWGTRSTVSTQADLFKLVSDNGGYKLEDISLNSGNKWLGQNLFTDNGGVAWTIEPTGDAGVFTIFNSAAGGYLAQSENKGLIIGYETNVVGTVTSAAKWRFLTEDEAKASLNGASADNPVSASFLIRNANFSRNHTQEWTVNASNKNMKGGPDNGNQCAEHWRSAFTVTQTLAVPNGKYKLTCQAAITDYANLNDGANYPVVFASSGAEEVSRIFLDMDASDRDKGLNVINPSFAAGKYLVETDEIIVSNGQLTIGAKGTRTDTWCAYDNFNLTYLGAVTDLSAFKPGYDKAVADATGVDQNAPMNASVLSDLKTAISTYNVDFSTFSSADDISAAVTALNGATKNANESIEAYAAIAAKLNTLDQSGKAAFLATEVGQKYTNKTYSTEDYSAELIAAAKAQTTVGADLTLGYITNPGAESGVADPWEVSGRVINGSADAHTGSSLFETAGWGPHFGKMSLKVTLPKGKYDFKAFGMASAGTTEYLVVYDEDESEKLAESASVVGVGASGENRWFQLTTTVNIPKEQTVVLAAESSTEGDHEWANFDDFSLIYQGEADEEPEAINVTAITLENSSASLNSTNNTATFVATVLPSDATNKKIKWTSSDENVAKVDKDGVVTGVAPGTATITATSADNEEIKATATVTTSYSETTVPTTKTVEHEDGSKTVYTFSGVNIIKNGSFEYGDPFFGWTNGKGSALAADKFTAADGTITSKVNEGSAEAGSIATKWSVDANTTYVFGYRTKANKEGTAEYQKVSLTNDDAETQKVSDDKQIVGTDWTDVQYIFTNAEYSGLQFRARWLNNNVAFDDFYLMKVTDIEEIAAPAPVIADLTVNDGVAVEASQDAKNITYVREFKAANKWQSLYLPFSVSLENNDADVVLAKIDDVIEDNGELVIKIIKVSKYETVVARRPLFIAAKTVGVKNIKTGVSTIDEPLDGGYDYSAAEFIGVLSKASAGQAGRYVMSGGELCLVPQSMNNLTLGVNRWAMYVNDGSSVRIRINAEGFSADEATAIASAVAESVENGEIFSINGAKVKDAKSGLYIKDGKKVYVK